MRRFAMLLTAALVISGCTLVPKPRIEPPPPPPLRVVSVLTVTVEPSSAVVKVTVRDNTRAWTTRRDGTIVEEFEVGDTVRIVASAPGYVTSEPVTWLLDEAIEKPPTIVLVKPPIVGRKGPVTLAGQSFSDDGGMWNALGTSLFWSLWGEKFDPERLDKNMEFFARNGGDYLRIFGMVGASSWQDRQIDPNWPDYWDVVDRVVARAARHGLRLQVTVFADAQVMMPDQAQRRVFADLWAVRTNREPERFIFTETANEYYQNGLEMAELVELTRRINQRTRVLVAPSATSCGTFPEGDDEVWKEEVAKGEISEQTRRDRIACVAEWTFIYSTGAADLATPHFDRDTSKSDGYDRPIRQPWEMNFGPNGVGANKWSNNEPIGPQSSGSEDNDPRRLMLNAVVTWLVGGASYTLHTGAGIRGGGKADLERIPPRSANLWEIPNISDTLAQIKAARAVLPAGIQNCSRHNAHWPSSLFTVDTERLTRAYQAHCGDGTFVMVPHGIKGSGITFTAKRDVEIAGVIIRAGQSYTVASPSAIVIGRVR